MPGPPLIGLTGGIAAGKSEALAILERLGAATISTDAIVHELLHGDDAIRERLVERWGAELVAGGEIDRDLVAGIVFRDRDELAWLESVLHPLVGERVLEWRRTIPDHVPVAVVEVPLLFESDIASIFDATVAVVASDEDRRRRAGERGTGALAEREQRQLSQQEKEARATHVVRNDGTLEELELRLRELLDELSGSGVNGR